MYYINFKLSLFNVNIITDSGRFQNECKGGGVVRAWQNSWGVRFVLMPLHTYPGFVVRIEKKEHIVNCTLATIKVYACYTVKIIK